MMAFYKVVGAHSERVRFETGATYLQNQRNPKHLNRVRLLAVPMCSSLDSGGADCRADCREFKCYARGNKTIVVIRFHRTGSIDRSAICSDPSHEVSSGIVAS